MFWLGFFVLCCAAFAYAAIRFLAPQGAKGAVPLRKYAVGAAGFGFLLCLLSGIVTVKAGNTAVQVLFGHVYHEPLHAGLHLINPLCFVDEMSVRTDNYRMSPNDNEGAKPGNDSVIAMSSNGMQMHLEISIPYRLVESSAPWVYENFGSEYIDKLVRPAARSAVTDAVAKYTDHECYSSDVTTGGKRGELAETIKKNIDAEVRKIVERYKDAPTEVISVPEVLIGKVDVPDTVKIAIEKKVSADQEAQAMTFRLKKESLEADRKVIEANGIQKFQKIVMEGISDKLLLWKGIEATTLLADSPNAKIIVIGGSGNGLPLILNDASVKLDGNNVPRHHLAKPEKKVAE